MAHDAYPSRGGSSTRDGRAAEGFVGSPLLSPFFACRDAGVGKIGQNMCRSVVFFHASLAAVSPWLCAVDEPRLQQY